jgi:hypothetical protein
VNEMSPDKRKRAYRRDMLLASAMVAAGLAISGLSLIELLARGPQQIAQATQPLQPSPASEAQEKPPAESKPGGVRPTTPAPESARPDEEAQKAGATPALPPAPAEKTAAPIKEK